MSVRASDVIRIIEDVAPRAYAEEWDNVGLQVGDPGKAVTHVGVTLDVTPEVLRQAHSAGVDMLLAHHPLIFSPLSSVRGDTPGGRLLMDLVRAGIVLFCAHTNLDCVNAGPSGVLAKELGLEDPEALVPRRDLVKIAVFVPENARDGVREIMGQAGAGHIGNYSHCTFAASGQGTFLPGEGTSPFIGEPGQMSVVEESRVEAVVPHHLLERVLAAVRAGHPYEEPVIDVWPLAIDNTRVGMGRIGNLARSETLEVFLDRVCELLQVQSLKVVGRSDRVSRLALCAGSGGDLWRPALHAGADVLLTGDVSYHVAQDAAAHGLVVVDAGHAATEQLGMPALAALLRGHLEGEGLDCEVSDLGPVRDPWVLWTSN